MLTDDVAPGGRASPRARREWLTRGVGSCSLLATLLLQLQPAVAQAPQSLELDMRYHAHRACPSGSAFLEVLHQHLAAGGEGPVDGDVTLVRRPAMGDFELRLQLRVLGRQYESVAHARSCDTLMRLAALNVAIARTGATPSSSAGSALEEPLVEGASAEADGLAGARPEFIPNSPSEAVPEFDWGPTAQAVVPEDSGAAAAEAVSPVPKQRRWFALAEVRTASAMLPRRAWGQGATLGWASAPWSLRVTGTWWRPQRVELSPDGSSPLQLAFAQQSLELSPCWGHELSGSVRIEGCAAWAAHRIHTNAPETRFASTLGLGALVSFRLWQGLHVELGGGLQVAAGAPDFRAARLVLAYQPGILEPVARFALGWEFAAPEERAATPEFEPALTGATHRAAR
jgi:hypothetical protein